MLRLMQLSPQQLQLLPFLLQFFRLQLVTLFSSFTFPLPLDVFFHQLLFSTSLLLLSISLLVLCVLSHHFLPFLFKDGNFLPFFHARQSLFLPSLLELPFLEQLYLYLLFLQPTSLSNLTIPYFQQLIFQLKLQTSLTQLFAFPHELSFALILEHLFQLVLIPLELVAYWFMPPSGPFLCLPSDYPKHVAFSTFH